MVFKTHNKRDKQKKSFKTINDYINATHRLLQNKLHIDQDSLIQGFYFDTRKDKNHALVPQIIDLIAEETQSRYGFSRLNGDKQNRFY